MAVIRSQEQEQKATMLSKCSKLWFSQFSAITVGRDLYDKWLLNTVQILQYDFKLHWSHDQSQGLCFMAKAYNMSSPKPGASRLNAKM